MIRLLFLASGPVKLYPIHEVEEIRDTDGNLVREGKPLLITQFIRGGSVPQWALEAARTRLSFAGLPDGLDPISQVCWYDTDYEANLHGWDKDTKRRVEEHLYAAQDQTFFLAEKPKLDPPYRNYDKHRKVAGKRTIEHVIKDIETTFDSAGFDVDHAIAYESENLNDPAVIAALHALNGAAEEVVAETVIAA